jgi:hypothetical protein
MEYRFQCSLLGLLLSACPTDRSSLLVRHVHPDTVILVPCEGAGPFLLRVPDGAGGNAVVRIDGDGRHAAQSSAAKLGHVVAACGQDLLPGTKLISMSPPSAPDAGGTEKE